MNKKTNKLVIVAVIGKAEGEVGQLDKRRFVPEKELREGILKAALGLETKKKLH